MIAVSVVFGRSVVAQSTDRFGRNVFIFWYGNDQTVSCNVPNLYTSVRNTDPPPSSSIGSNRNTPLWLKARTVVVNSQHGSRKVGISVCSDSVVNSRRKQFFFVNICNFFLLFFHLKSYLQSSRLHCSTYLHVYNLLLCICVSVS